MRQRSASERHAVAGSVALILVLPARGHKAGDRTHFNRSAEA
jgi:hypothetical protein